MNISLRIAALLSVACIAIGGFTLHVTAQELEVPALEIEKIDLENLPQVSLFIKGENLDGALSEVELAIEEDGVAQALLDRNTIERGLQIALVVDPALDLASIGNSGDVVQFEIANGASSLIQSGILSVRTDFLNAYAIPEDSNAFGGLLDEWQRDHQAVVNRLYQYAPGDASTAITLLDSLDSVMEAMQNDAPEGDSVQTIVLFSDGLSSLDDRDTDQIIRNAQAQDISIRVVLLGDVSSASRRNLISIAEATAGSTVTYESASSLNEIWRKLNDDSQLEELVYRLGQAAPSQVSVSLLAADGSEIVATQEFPEVTLEPVELEIVLPNPSGNIERTGESPESTIEELEPDVLPLMLNFSFPDGVEREIQSVTYTVDDVVSTQESAPFDSYELSIADLDEGLYSIEVMVVDEYGLSSVDSVPVNVVVIRPQAVVNAEAEAESASTSGAANVISTEATQSELVQEDASNQGMNILGLQLPETIEIFGVTFLVNGITLLIALFPVIFLLALFLYWLTQRNEQPAEPDYGYYEYDNNGYFYRFESSADDSNMQMTQPQVSVIEPEEELTMPVKLPSFYTNAAAYLVYVSGGEHLPQKIPIETNEPVRIGRKKSFCDQILDDQRVSRLHAVITYEGGNFYVKDEGSSGGTFVNRRKLGPTDKQLLKSNDIVNFNEVEYRMEVTEPDSTANADFDLNSTQEPNEAESVVS